MNETPQTFAHRHLAGISYAKFLPLMHLKDCRSASLAQIEFAVAIGPNYQHHADGHDKLNAQALAMGGVSLPIYGIKDQWASLLLDLVVIPNNRLATSELRGANLNAAFL